MADATGEPLSQDQLREQRLQRNLKIIVIGLGALIIIGLGAAIAKIFILATDKPASRRATPPVAAAGANTGTGTGAGAAPSTATSTTVAVPGGEIAVEIPKGARIVSVSLSGNHLAILHEGPAGSGIAIIDLETGRPIANVKPQEAVPRN